MKYNKSALSLMPIYMGFKNAINGLSEKWVNSFFKVVFCLVFISFATIAHAQVKSLQVASPNVAPPTGNPPGAPTPVSGPSSLVQGAQTTSTYTVNAGSGATSYSWGLSNNAAGSITGTSTTGTMTWNPSFYGTVAINCSARNSYGSTAATPKTVTVTAAPSLVPGIISPSSQTINYNTNPAITQTAAPSGGNGSYTYQWQTATPANPSAFSNISGFTSQGFPSTGYNITSTALFRRMDSSNGTSTYTNIVTVNVYPLTIGNIMPETQDISSGATVFPLSVSSVSGNASTYSYLWQTSPDNINWTSITGTNSLNYSPSPVSATTWYRLQVTCNGTNFYSRSARVLIGTCPQLGTNPGSTSNYIVTSTFRNGGITSVTDAQIAGMTICDVNQTIQYADGLGRPVQTVQTKASPTQRDLVQPMAYDQYDRNAVKYLPYEVPTTAANDGSYKTTALSDQGAFYSNPTSTASNAPGVVQTNYPSGSTNFEPSPLNRPVEQGFPGQSWQLSTSGVSGSGHTITIAYATNNAGSLTSGAGYWAQQYEVTPNYTYNGNYTGTNALSNPGGYPYGTLYVTVTRNENWSATQSNPNLNTTQEYKDIFGNMVLKRTFNYNTATSANETLSTYYVYDGYHNLTYVLPPLANPDAGGITQNVLDNLCYQYRYDGRNRLREKKIPGKGWEIMVYNNLNQLIETQDSVQRMDNPQQVTYMKYDSQGRPVQTGIYTITGNPGSDQSMTLQAAATAQAVNWETKSATGAYSNITIPTTNASVLTTNYYDDYNNSGAPLATYSAPAGASNMTRGLLTSSQTAVLNNPVDGLWDVQYYDDLGRVIKGYSQHYLGGHTGYSTANYDVSTSYYNFTNQLDTGIRQHYRAGFTSPKVVVANFYTYDPVGRRLLNTEQITGSNGVVQAASILSQITYNGLGQSYVKNVSSGLQIYNYAYNERGWLASMTPTIGGNFAETLAYDHPTGTVTPQYNGNVSQFSYNSPYMAAQWGQPRTYVNTVNYTYDNLNRFTQSTSSLAESDESASYDLNGNLKTLVRNGPWNAALGYAYLNSGISNELGAVTSNGVPYRTYTYDGNGNALDNGDAASEGGTKTITYNMLNLPQYVQEGSVTVTYAYDATGNKLRDVDGSGIIWDYDKGIVYQQGKIDFIQNEEGRVSLYSDSVTYNYSYNLKDYLGNLRALYDNGNTGGAFRIIQENNYYAFGLAQTCYDFASGNHYLYNGKEQQFDLLNQYDYGARFYDAIIARWTTIDPDAENSRRWSPYNYGENNPIRNTDPDGMDYESFDGVYGQSIADLQQQFGSNNIQTMGGSDKTPFKSDTGDPVGEAATRVLRNSLTAQPDATATSPQQLMSPGMLTNSITAWQVLGPLFNVPINGWTQFDNWMKTHGQVDVAYGWAEYMSDGRALGYTGGAGATHEEMVDISDIYALASGGNFEDEEGSLKFFDSKNFSVVAKISTFVNAVKSWTDMTEVAKNAMHSAIPPKLSVLSNFIILDKRADGILSNHDTISLKDADKLPGGYSGGRLYINPDGTYTTQPKQTQ
jgi:RHS repeat-associated protein